MSQLIPDVIKAAARRAISLNLPFALYALPGENEIHFFASEPVDGENNIDMNDNGSQAFVVTSFASSCDNTYGIKPQYTAEDVLKLPEKLPKFDGAYKLTRGSSTDYWHYVSNMHEAQKHLRYSTKKVVLSRRISVEIDTDAVSLAEIYFNKLPHTFRALYFTQETGLWITATPELFLRHEEDSDCYYSMALAGTQDATQINPEDWDEKNTLEHNLVLEHIKQIFYKAGLQTEISDRKLVRFGNVAHLCHSVNAHGNTSLTRLIDSLNPTPAVAGYPVEKSLVLIQKYEPHDRMCYGGWLGLKNGGNVDLYVNLRCAMLEQNAEKLSINIICGGGIMRASEPKSEWMEAGEKALPLWESVLELSHTTSNGLAIYKEDTTSTDPIGKLELPF